MDRRAARLPAPASAAAAVVALGSAALLSACHSPTATDVIAGDGVLCDITRRLAAADLQVKCLIRPNDDPHRFQLSPQQTRALRQARLVLINGYGLTPALERLPGVVPVAELAVPDSPRIGAAAHDDHGDEQHAEHNEPADHTPDLHHSGRDPHVWHDPRQAAAMVHQVSLRLQSLQPAALERNAAIQRREQGLVKELASLHAWNGRQFATLPSGSGGRTLATGHRAFVSLSRAYGLTELPVVDALSSSETLRPQALNAVVQRLRRDGIPRLFSEQWPAGKAMIRISDISGVPLAPGALRADGLNPMPGATGDQSGDLMATLTANTCLIVDNLGGRCDPRGQRQLLDRWTNRN